MAAAALAQERREPLRGSAITAAGAAWSGATVHLLSRPLPGDERFGIADEITATTDDKGRFLVSLLPGRFYLAWASETLADGRVLTAWPVEDVIAGRPLELIADVPRAPMVAKLEGAAAWRARGKLVATVMSATSPAIVIACDVADDSLRLPPLPGRRARVQITCDGLPLFQWPDTIDLTASEAAQPRLKAPRDVRIRVVDDKQAPVPGVVLALGTLAVDGAEERPIECTVGTTDAAGDAVVTLPLGAGKFGWVGYRLALTSPGFAPVRKIDRFEVAVDHDASKPEPAMTLKLTSGEQHVVRCARGDRPIVGPFVVRTRAGSIGQSWDPQPTNRLVQADAQGCVELLRVTGVPAMLLAPTGALGLTVPPGSPLHPVALLGCVAPNEAAPRLEFDAAKLRTLGIQVVDAAGTPVAAAHLAVLLPSAREPLRALADIGTDRSGRAAVLLPPGLPVLLVAWTEAGSAVVPVADDGDTDKPIVVCLAEAKSLPGKVIDKNGKPVPFARVEVYVSGGKLAALGAGIGIVHATTARDGTFRLPLYAGGAYSLRGVTTPDDERYLRQQWTVGKNEPDELLLDLGKER
jgi:hypothetical protein